MKDAARLGAYFVATIFIGALLAPLLYWGSQALTTFGLLPFLSRYGFETFFHRGLLIAAALLLWPFLRLSGVRRTADLGLAANYNWSRDAFAGVLLSTIPLICCGVLLIVVNAYSLRHSIAWTGFGKVLAASITVPLIEEMFFRGIVLGVLLKTGRHYTAIFATSAIFSVIHFLKAPGRTSTIVTWSSGLNSIIYSFGQFRDLTMVIAAFATLFVIGWILADARVLTNSLWLSIGLHAGWIFGSGTFNRVALEKVLLLPWLGKNLLVGILPLALAGLTWVIMRTWLKYDRGSKV